MPAIEVGRICVKTAGREAGKHCVILEVIDKNFVLITGPKEVTGIKRRRTNINHLKPLEQKIKIEKDSSDEEVNNVLKESKLLEKVKEKVSIE